MESKKISLWISKASNLSAQLTRPAISPIEAVMFLRAGRECASEMSSFLMHKMTNLSDPGEKSAPGSEASGDGNGPARFTEILRLQQAKNVLVNAINSAALLQQKQHNGSVSCISQLSITPAARRGTDGGVAEHDRERHQRDSEEELQTLMRVRGLLAVENMKMDQVIASISEGSSALQALHARLEEVGATLTFTHTLVRGLLRVKTLDDLALRISWVLFVVVVLFVWSQRIFGLGAVHVL